MNVVSAVSRSGGGCEVNLNRSAEEIFSVELVDCSFSLGRIGELDEAIRGVTASEWVNGHIDMLTKILLA
jgi:hypothetical protein